MSAVAREFVEPLPAAPGESRWLTRIDGGGFEVVWAIEADDPAWIGRIDRAAAQWLGFAHPRVGRIGARIVREPTRIAFAIDDDRGPALVDAVAQLAAAPVDRERWAIAQLITVADALAAMARHVPGFVHGRLEPQHVFVDASGHARLRAPLGLVARPERGNYVGAGQVIGTPQFLAPEQVRGEPATAASDVFALASQLALALTGQLPFARDAIPATLMAILTEPPAPIATHAAGLDGVLARAFAKPPADRYPEPGALAAALYACVPEAAEYDAVMSDRVAEWWPSAAPVGPWTPYDARFDAPPCQMRWDQLAPTAAGDDVRHCHACAQPVVRVRSLAQVVALAGRRCVSYEPR